MLCRLQLETAAAEVLKIYHFAQNDSKAGVQVLLHSSGSFESPKSLRDLSVCPTFVKSTKCICILNVFCCIGAVCQRWHAALKLTENDALMLVALDQT